VKVELRYASLPAPIGFFAVHYWFVVFEDGRAERWEVWQTRNAGGRSVGHVHCDLKGPDEGVGGGPACIAMQWQGESAARLKQVLRESNSYPYCQLYRYWPGPNSNTFAAWVLREAGIDFSLPRKAIGCRYRLDTGQQRDRKLPEQDRNA
jgi:hypothetical protein